MGLFPVWRHKLICIVLSLCKHACKSVCDIKPGIDPYPLLARSWKRWWPDFVTFAACKKFKIWFKKTQCISNRCKDLFKQKKYFGVRCTLSLLRYCRKYFSGNMCYKLYSVVFHTQGKSQNAEFKHWQDPLF